MTYTRRTVLKTITAALGAEAMAQAGVLSADELPEAVTTQRITPGEDPNLTLWYREPASVWLQALPIGNGRLGAMVFGGVPTETLQLNESTLWAGSPHDYTSPDGLAVFPEIRRLEIGRAHV